MSFKDELAEIIKSARDAKQKRQSDMAKARDWWGGFRDNEIKPALVEAEAAWKEAGIFSLSQRKNGDTICLGVGPSNKAPEHEICFRLDSNAGHIACESSEETLAEPFEVEKVTIEKIRDKVKEFFRLVVQHYI